LYRNLPTDPPVRRRPKQFSNPGKRRPVTRTGATVGLSQGQYQPLWQQLTKGLHQGLTPSPAPPPTPSPVPRQPEASPPSGVATPGTGAKIRMVSLLPGESVSHTFSHERGLVPQPEDQGRMLVLTNQRVIAFGQKDGNREVVVMPLNEVKAVAVNSARRSKGSLIQGGLMVVAGVFLYVLLAYWLTGRIDGPTVPVIRMDLSAFLVFLAILSGVGIMAQFYFGKPDGEVTFQGDGVRVTFPFKGATAEEQIFEVVNSTFAARQRIVG